MTGNGSVAEARFSAPVAALRAAAAMRPFESIIVEARRLLPEAEARGGPDFPALHILAGNALSAGGDLADAIRHLNQAYDAAMRIPDLPLEAEAAAGIGATLLAADDHGAALQHFERAEKLATECGYDLLRANLLRRMGVSFSILGRHQQAMQHLAEAGAVLGALEDTAVDRLQLTNSTLNARSREIESWPADHPGFAEANAALLPRWLELADDARRGDVERMELIALGNYAINARHAGALEDSIRVLHDLIPRYDALGMKPNVVISWNHLGYASEALGDWSGAKRAFEEALTLLGDGGSARERRDACDGLARACEAIGDAWGALAAVKAARLIETQMDDEEARRVAAQRQHRAELARVTERRVRLVEQDPLTGLSNRRALETWLKSNAREGDAMFSLLLLDLDGFKDINDRFGHAVGDHVLQDVGKLLRQSCREADIPVRYGGEEFVVALPDTDAHEAYVIAERIRTSIASFPWSRVAPGLAVTTSVGCASSDETSVDGPGSDAGHTQLGADASLDAVLARADRRLYEAKRQGRNRVCAMIV
jgi:diguanylate cyclase (GGDEF)-like protein